MESRLLKLLFFRDRTESFSTDRGIPVAAMPFRAAKIPFSQE